MAAKVFTEENMVKLRNLDEDSIQENLHNRFKQEQIYTYVGTVLIAINPFRMLPLYTPDVLERYHENGALGQSPHTYAIADNAYRNLIRDWKDQSIVVSGESGAGKTETTKHVLEYLTEMSNAVHPLTASDETPLEDQCISAQMILEAFGNAKTVRNDNSSRYGKWIEIIFGRAGNIKGAIIQTYLLEKSRVITLDPGERSYHVFYQLCAAAAADSKLNEALLFKQAGGPSPKNFAYLATSGTYECAGVTDADEFERLKLALAAFDITGESMLAIMKLVAAIMHLGNVKFKSQVQRKLGCDVDGCAVTTKPALEAAASLLGLTYAALETALIERNYTTGGETAVIRDRPATRTMPAMLCRRRCTRACSHTCATKSISSLAAVAWAQRRSAARSASWISSGLRFCRPTRLSSCASTSAMRSCRATSTRSAFALSSRSTRRRASTSSMLPTKTTRPAWSCWKTSRTQAGSRAAFSRWWRRSSPPREGATRSCWRKWRRSTRSMPTSARRQRMGPTPSR